MARSVIKGEMDVDKNNNPIQKGSTFTTADGTGTPQQSPITVSDSEVEVIAPAKAAQIAFRTVDENIWIDSVTGVGSSQGFEVLATDGWILLDIKEGATIFMIRDSADAEVQFFFNLLA